MLHTLNKAWTKILAQHIYEHNMFVYSTSEERKMIADVFNKVEQEIGDLCFMWVIDEDTVTKMKDNTINFIMQDNILISHDIHDVMVKDYLSRHCRNKC